MDDIQRRLVCIANRTPEARAEAEHDRLIIELVMEWETHKTTLPLASYIDLVFLRYDEAIANDVLADIRVGYTIAEHLG